MNQAPRRRWNIQPWPWPGDNWEDKAKRIALSYRQLVFDISQGHINDPAGELHRLDHHWAQYGHYWPCPGTIPIDDTSTDWFTAADIAHLIHKTPRDIYQWARRGNIRQRVSADGSPEYSLSSAEQYRAQKRQRRTANTT